MKQNIFFDLDGTLIDSSAGIFGCVRRVIEEMKLPQRSNEEMAQMMGLPLWEGLAAAIGLSDHSIIEKAVKLYRAYRSSLALEAVVYPGIESMLEILYADGRRLFCVANKPMIYAERIVCHFPFGRFIERVYGSDLDDVSAKKNLLIRSVLEIEKLKTKETAMVGDRYWDIKGAKENGLFAVGVLWGFGSREELEQAESDIIISHPSELTISAII